jgi:hypothetical protein
MSICSCKHNSVFHKCGNGPCAKCQCQKKTDESFDEEIEKERSKKNPDFPSLVEKARENRKKN